MTVKFIDLFAGIGGFRLALESLGAECVMTSEIDKFARQTYQANFGEEGDWDNYDMRDLNPHRSLPDYDILCAGFPCQPFSIAGQKEGFEDRRGNLFYDILRVVEETEPKVIFLENVKNLVYHDKGRTFSKMTQYLNLYGYSLAYKVLNSKDFGVPQNRERIFVVGWRDRSLNFTLPDGPMTYTLVGSILEPVVDEKYTISDKIWAGHKRRKQAHRDRGNGFGYNVVNKFSTHTATLSARYGKDGSEILIYQEGENPRRLTPREAARIQGYPDDFIIPVSNTQAYKQFGNSVTVPVVRAVSKEILKQLL